MNTEIQTAIDNLKKAMAATDANLAKMNARATKVATPERVAATIQTTRTTVKVGAIVTTLGFLVTVYATVQAALIISNIVRMVYTAYLAIKTGYRACEGYEPTFSELREYALSEVTAELVVITPALFGGLTRGLGGLSQDIGNLTDNVVHALLAKMDEEAPFDGSGIAWDTPEDDLSGSHEGDSTDTSENSPYAGLHDILPSEKIYEGNRATEQTGRGRK